MVPVNGCPIDPCAAGAIAELGGGARQSTRGGVGDFRVEVDDVVADRSEGHHDVVAETDIQGQLRHQFDVVLNVARDIPIAEPLFLSALAIGTVNDTKQETGERVASGGEVPVFDKVRVRRRVVAEVKVSRALLALIVVLIGAPQFPANIERVLAFNPEIIVVKHPAKLAIDRIAV